MKHHTPAWIALAAWESVRTALSLAAAASAQAAAGPVGAWVLVALAAQAFSAGALALLSRPDLGAASRRLAVYAAKAVDLVALAWIAASMIFRGPDGAGGEDGAAGSAALFLPMYFALAASAIADIAACGLAADAAAAAGEGA